MSKRSLIYGAAAVVVAVIVIASVAWFAGSSQPTGTNGQQGKPSSSSSANGGTAPSTNALSSASQNQHIAPGMTNAAPIDNATAQKILQEMMKQKGLKAMAPPKEYLQAAVATGDNVKIARAFNDMVYAGWPPDQVIAALKDFLDNSNPFVRYLAGQYLFVVGDQSGYNALLALVQSNTPLQGLEGAGDLRVQAATILAQFRQTDAVSAIAALYSKTPSPDLSQALANLGAQVPGENQMPFVASTLAITEYAKGGATQFIPQITSTFNSTQNPDVKAAAAWALATMTGDQNATNYLVQIAQADLNNPSQTGSVSERNVISYLGSIQTPAAKQTLEAALSSSDPGIVQVAALNLVFNQGGSSQVNQLVASELSGTPNPLGADMALNLAPQLLNDPQVQAAGQTFSEHDGSGAWQRATVDRANWSTYNWMSGVYIAKPK